MERMVYKQLHSNLTTVHSHKLTHRCMAMVLQQQIPLDMPIIKHRQCQLLITKDNRDINRILDNYIVTLSDHMHCLL